MLAVSLRDLVLVMYENMNDADASIRRAAVEKTAANDSHGFAGLDWKAIASASLSAMPNYGKGIATSSLELTDSAKEKAKLLDESAGLHDRLSAANTLLGSDASGTVSLTDAHGKARNFKIERITQNGQTIIKVSESGQTLVQGVLASAEKPNFLGATSANANALDRGASSTLPPERSSSSAASNPGRYMRVPRRRPQGMSYSDGGSSGSYRPSEGGVPFNPAGVDHSAWQGVKRGDGSVSIKFRGCQVDTDGAGAHRHTEDRTRQSRTSLKMSDNTYLDTDKDNFFVLPPSVAKAYGIKLGDLGWLVQSSTGKAVPVVFGDSGPEGKLGEASVKALNSLGYDVNGARGVSGDEFEVVFVPGSGDGTGDIARNPDAMAAKLSSLGTSPETKVADTAPKPDVIA